MTAAFLKVIKGSSAGQVLALSGETVILGRHPLSQIVLDNASVSRQHAQIVEEHGVFLVEDLRSRNGTQVNRQPIRGKTELHDGDEIKVCDYAFTFMLKATGPATPVQQKPNRIIIDGSRQTIDDDYAASEPEIEESDKSVENSSILTSSRASRRFAQRRHLRP